MLQWTFLGFSPRLVLELPAGIGPPVVEVCSVSECLSPAPDDRISHWTHNSAGFYETEALAWGVVPIERAGAYELFGYRVLNERFTAAGAERFEPADVWADLPLDEPGEWFVRAGYDLVSRTASTFFECSPLSCNLMANELSVNESCLVDDLDAARTAGLLFAGRSAAVEPGDYYLVEVLRSR